MCCCGKPTRNDEPGYSWDGKTRGTYGVEGRAPVAPEGALVLYDEPGRCGGVDSHSHHFRVVDLRGDGKRFALLVRHGGGDESIEIGGPRGLVVAFGNLPGGSDARYWLCQWFYHHRQYALRDAVDAERQKWTRAAVDKRIKIKRRGGFCTVSIEPKREIPAETQGA